jgi:hypothetical protein
MRATDVIRSVLDLIDRIDVADIRVKDPRGY